MDKRPVTYPIWTATIIVPINITMGIVEIHTSVRHIRIVPGIEVSSATISTDIIVPRSCHMIDDCINVDPVEFFLVHVSSYLMQIVL